ncbi:hypothetical protein NESM_000392700 [Novymonas esmeraldas]|uniref:Uncharacterized protein n=1 Tax=Novymonas esmeraldas TaxID=1808958 RepID=A0AAW0ENB8_9TRYP
MFARAMYTFPAEAPDEAGPPLPRSTCPTPGQVSMTEVFPGAGTPGTTSIGAGGCGGTRHVDCAERRRTSTSSNVVGGIISVATHDGDELHYPIIQGRAGGSLSPQSHAAELAGGVAARPPMATRVHRHASIISGSMSSHSMLYATLGSMVTDEGETVTEAREAYRQSRLTPSSIQRHRRSSNAISRSPSAAVALRGEPVEEVVRASQSPVPTPLSSLPSTPRHSLQRTPVVSSRTCWPNAAGDLDPGSGSGSGGAAAERRHRFTVDGSATRLEDMGVSTPEMAEYFAESNTDPAHRRASAWMLSGNNSSSSWPVRHAAPVSRSTTETAPHLTAATASSSSAMDDRGTQAVLTRLLQLMEEQSVSMRELHKRMDSLENTNRTLVDRVQKVETSVAAANAGAVLRVSAESASPSITRTSGSMESTTHPTTRAPSKAIN